MPSTFLASKVEIQEACSSSFSAVTTTMALYPLPPASAIMEPHISAKKGFATEGSTTPIVFVLFFCWIRTIG